MRQSHSQNAISYLWELKQKLACIGYRSLYDCTYIHGPVILFEFKMLNMSLKRAIRNVIIGDDKFIESYSEYRQVLLSGEFAVIGMLFCLVSGIFNYYIGYTEALLVLAVTAFFFLVTLLLHRRGNHSLANYFLLATLNISVYILASSESAKTGSFLFFIVSSIASFAVFSYHERLLSILFAVFTYVLFALAYFIDFSILPQRDYNDDVLLFSIVINFSAALPGHGHDRIFTEKSESSQCIGASRKQQAAFKNKC